MIDRYSLSWYRSYIVENTTELLRDRNTPGQDQALMESIPEAAVELSKGGM